MSDQKSANDQNREQAGPPAGIPGQHHHAAPGCPPCNCGSSYGPLKSCTWDSNAGNYLCSHEPEQPR